MAFIFYMKKAYRIKKNEEFDEIINQKHSFGSASFVCYVANRKEEHARVGISVSKKLGDAVHRNKIKRQVREMVYHILDFEECQMDLIFIVRKGFLDKDFMTNQEDLEKLVKKAII